MPRQCSVCAHDQLQDIDAALLAGTPYRKVAERFDGISVTALSRHRNQHLLPVLAKARETAETEYGDTLIQQLRTLVAKADSLLAKAESAGDLRTALAGVREVRSTLETLAELEGELDRRATVNVLISPEWQQVRAAISAALAPYPDAKVAVAERLQALEASDAGN